MKCILSTEFYKLLRSKTLWITTLLMIYLSITLLISGDVASANLISFLLKNLLSYSTVISIYGIVIAHEYVAGYFKDALFAGNTKWQVYIARYLAFYFGIVIICFLPILLITMFFFLKDGATVVFTNCDMIVLQNICLLFLFFLCFSAFLMMFLIIGKSYASVVLFILIYSNLCVFIYKIFPQSEIPNWISYSIIGIQEKLLSTKDTVESLKIVGTLLGQFFVYTGIGYVVFAKRELR